MIKNNSKVIGEYKSVILNLENKKIKGRLFITKDGIAFERKIGILSKKFEPEFFIKIESISIIKKEGYFDILITQKEDNQVVTLTIDTPVETNEIIENINTLVNENKKRYVDKKQSEIDERMNQINYSTYIYDTIFKTWTFVSLLFNLINETMKYNWDRVDEMMNEFDELSSTLNNNKINLQDDTKKIKTAIKSRDSITIINSIKSTMDSLGEVLYGQIPYKEWKEFTPTVKPVWQNLQFFYLFTVAIFQADYFDKLGKKEERDRAQANVLKYIPIINNHFSDNLFDNSKYSTKTFRETENTIKQLISETEEKIEKLLKDSLKQVSLLV